MKIIHQVMQHPEVIATIEEFSELGEFYDYADAKGYLQDVLEEIIDRSLAEQEARIRAEVVREEQANMLQRVREALEIGETK